jgi:carboxyl-terminal processing protease
VRAVRIGILVSILSVAVVAADAPQDWRVTALAAFDETWQTVNDTHYDPSFGGVNWTEVRAELRPKAERAETPDVVRQVIVEMLARLRQSHFVLLTSSPVGQPMPGDASVHIDIRVHDEGLVVTRVDDPGVALRVRAGDVVVSVDGNNPVALAVGADERTRRLDAWRRAVRALHGGEGSVARLVVRRLDGDTEQVDIVRSRQPGEVVQLGNLPPVRVKTEVREARTPSGKRVGVIRFNVWMIAVGAAFASAIDTFRDAEGVVIDLRGNPGGLAEMMRGIAGHLVDEPALIGSMHMRDAVLEFRANPRRSTVDGRRVEPFSGRLAILVDELTASASECFAGGLQDVGRARLFGARTMGQALPAATRQLANGDVLMYAIADFVTSRNRSLEGKGVTPDEEILPSRRLLAAGRDEPLERALAWIDSRL